MGKMKKVIIIILAIIAFFCFVKVGGKYIEDEEAKTVYKEIEQIEEKIENENINEKEKFKKKYSEMKKINEDYVFWLNVKGTNINYPVAKSKDNYEYLHMNFDKNKNSSGTIFMDFSNRMDDFNTIIHGHNMKNGTMFNNLVKFKNEDFYKENKEITIYRENEKEVYEIFSVYVVEAEEDFLRRGYSKEYIDYINKKSIYKEKREINEKDKIITLSTCSYEFENARTVVHAVKKAS
ncbi:MAG: class B sortase [Clostridium sp.]|uniref:class B sortase n=1 Tax=Clostridium sp. TaxID=1506 RepID=UPI003F3159F9